MFKEKVVQTEMNFIATLITRAERWKQPKCPISRCVDKHNELCPYMGTLLSHKRDALLVTCYSVGDPSTSCKVKEARHKRPLFYWPAYIIIIDSAYMKSPEQASMWS